MATEVVDLSDIVLRWAKKMYDVTKNKDQAKIPKEHLEFTPTWKRIKFTHSDPDYDDRQPEAPQTHVLFKTYFTNETDQEQEYSFKTERTTSSSCSVDLERAVTISEEVGLSLKTPCEILELSAGFSKEVTVTKSQGQEFEQEMTWGVDSVIKVPANTRTTAQLVISEAQLAAKFSVRTQVAGRMLVTVTNTRENNALVKVVEGDFAEIMENAIQEEKLKGFKIDRRRLTYKTRGTCNFRYAIEQDIKLQQEDV